MAKIQTGYEDLEEEKDIPEPGERKWEVNEIHIGTTQAHAIYVNIMLDGEVVGSARLPNKDHFYWLRKKLRGHEEEEE